MKSFFETAVLIAIGFFAASAAADDTCDPKGEYPNFQERDNWLTADFGLFYNQNLATFYTSTAVNEDGSTSFQLKIVKGGSTFNLQDLTTARIGVWPNCDEGSVPNGNAKFQINLSGSDIDQDNLVYQIPVTEMPIPNCLSLDSICLVSAFKGTVYESDSGQLFDVNLRVTTVPYTPTTCPRSVPRGPNGVVQCPISVDWVSPTPSPSPSPFSNCQKEIDQVGLEPTFDCGNDSDCSTSAALYFSGTTTKVGRLVWSTKIVNSQSCFNIKLGLNSIGQKYIVTNFSAGIWGVDQDLKEISDNYTLWQIQQYNIRGMYEWHICPKKMYPIPSCTSITDMLYTVAVEAETKTFGSPANFVTSPDDCPLINGFSGIYGCPVKVQW
eukprot:CAMPEP_0184751918 /NCGR_PEP_ID=MMETSP0315-20130426/43304_1 /TAXON_ID=101924 /ORGANISM="Rhodosorus marinus, Strain UTEX LB 2760" /LENGTH=381 /DNA_ID=CAMNT_0027231219 /DNA_START=502 /DNA_END=1644 /DNA_ORIENTATION=-